MAIKQLTEEQIRTWTLEQKDRWWLENVYQGDVPQFTVRSVTCGFLLGGILSCTNLYVGAKTGWTLGVGIVLGLVLEILKMATKGKFPISGVGFGLAFVIQFNTCLAMAFGAFVFWLCEKFWPQPESAVNRVVVQNQEPICAGVIAGAALMGIAVMVYTYVIAGG